MGGKRLWIAVKKLTNFSQKSVEANFIKSVTKKKYSMKNNRYERKLKVIYK